MDFWQIVLTPFSLLLKLFCQVFDSYGIALILFTIVVKVILFPISLKGKKSMIRMNLAQADLKEIQKRCGNDRERYNQEVQKYYTDNNISPMGGCGWSLIPLAILMPLYAIIRRPMKHMMRLSDSATGAVASALGLADFAAGNGYGELTLASMINAGNIDTAIAAAGGVGSLFIINFNFLGMDLSQIPSWKIWENLSWSSFGLFLLPIISAVLSVVSMIVSQKTNKMSANDSGSNPSMKSMYVMQPLISLWIGFTLPAGLCVYWIANSVLMMVQEWLCGKMLRKDYEAARIAKEEQERKAKEEEKVRRREAAERKAAAIAANKGKSKKGQVQPQKDKVDNSASREGLRSNARGRAYDPNRYPVTVYHDPDEKYKKTEPVEEEALTEEEKAILAEAGVEIPEIEETVNEGEYEEAYASESEDGEPNE